MRAFVAGATGYTGQNVVKTLRERGGDVVAHVRPDSPRLSEWQTRFKALGAACDTTPWQQQTMQETMRRLQPTHVFALLGTTRARARAAAQYGVDASYEAVDYGLSALLLRAVLESAPSACFIYLSSVGVRAETRNPYLSVRWRLEEELKRSGLRYLIVRPSFITGADREESRVAERAAANVANIFLRVLAALGARRLHARFASLTGPQLAAALASATLAGDCSNTVLETPQLRALARG